MSPVLGFHGVRKVLILNQPAQLKALSSPLRSTLLDQIGQQGPVSARELAQEIGVRRTAVYHHLKILVDAGLVEKAEGDGGVELYQAVAENFRIDRVHDTPEWNEALGAMASQYCRLLSKRFEAAYHDPSVVRSHDPEVNEVYYEWSVFRLAPEDLAEINRGILDLGQRVRDLGGKHVGDPGAGKSFTFAVFMVPSEHDGEDA